jgi:pyridoxal phosphate enzyme (YggS family)
MHGIVTSHAYARSGPHAGSRRVTERGGGFDLRLAGVRATIAEAARCAGRDPAGVTIVAVTKTLPPEAVERALAAGLADVGENYVQEAKAKRARVPGGRWHLIGGLQRNKVRAAVATFDRLHTVDDLPVAVAVDAAARSAGRRMPVLLQVNAADDATKRGVAPDGALELCRAVMALPALAVDGLMTVGRLADDPETARPGFRTLREVRDHVAGRLGVELPHLSMGMSGDFGVAVEEGATLVRLGRVLFGVRRAGAWREG